MKLEDLLNKRWNTYQEAITEMKGELVREVKCVSPLFYQYYELKEFWTNENKNYWKYVIKKK